VPQLGLVAADTSLQHVKDAVHVLLDDLRDIRRRLALVAIAAFSRSE
jgi:hypothetical protein